MISEQKQEVLRCYNEGLKAYKLRKWDEAEDWFAQALAADADDGPSALYLERVKEYIKNPPPENWDGIFVMTTK